MTGSGPVGIGVIGAGMISDTYLENLTSFPDVRVHVIGDLDTTRAATQAEKYGVSASGSGADVLAHPDVELVVNLTTPASHFDVDMQAISAGKHVWSEKPISIDRESGRKLLDSASRAGLLVGVAPDTVLGPGIQTARRAIADGVIGRPLSAQTVLQYPGPDLFHPNPAFLFAKGAGPLFDMGPYYLTTLVHVFGAFSRVSAVGSQAHATRTVQVGELKGTTFPVEVPTHLGVIAQFADGGVSQSVFSFESPLSRQGVVEITGTEGTLVIPDPNFFTGDIKVTHAPTFEDLENEPEWRSLPVTGALAGRGTGALDLARAIRTGSQPLASGDLAFHILDTMMAIDEAAKTGRTVDVHSTVDRVPLVAEGFDPFASTL